MDAFFASVELLRFPQLKGLPVVIGGGRRQGEHFDAALLHAHRSAQPHLFDPAWYEADAATSARQPPNTPNAPHTALPNVPPDELARLLRRVPPDCFARLRGYAGRGVITTATYAARQFGVGSAMGLMKAARLCPDAVLLPVDFDEVRRYSRWFKSLVTEIAPTLEDRGVDEVFIDFTHVPGGQREGGRVLARLIQKTITDATGLTCSVGVAPNKLLAKMASEFHKPNGITVLHDTDLASLIWPLPCRKVNGIGPKAGAKLAGHGIHTIGELAAQDPVWLRQHFGQHHGTWLHEAAWGRDDRPVVTSSEPVSISRETTFERDLHAQRDRAELGAVFTRLCEQLAADLARKGFAGRTIGVKLRYSDFTSVTRDHSLDAPVCTAADLRRAAGQALKRAPLQRPLRLLGVRVGKLCKLDDQGHPLQPTSTAQAGTQPLTKNNKQKLPSALINQAQAALFFE